MVEHSTAVDLVGRGVVDAGCTVYDLIGPVLLGTAAPDLAGTSTS